MPPHQSSLVTRTLRPNHLIMAPGGREHTITRVLRPRKYYVLLPYLLNLFYSIFVRRRKQISIIIGNYRLASPDSLDLMTALRAFPVFQSVAHNGVADPFNQQFFAGRAVCTFPFFTGNITHVYVFKPDHVSNFHS